MIAAALMASTWGCTTSPAEFESLSPQLVEDISDNYQTAYERVYRTGRRCYVTGFFTTSQEVEAQLFPELGFGEVLFIFVNMGTKSPMLRLRVDKRDSGARVSVTSTFYLPSEQARWRQKLLGWARGETDC